MPSSNTEHRAHAGHEHVHPAAQQPLADGQGPVASHDHQAHVGHGGHAGNAGNAGNAHAQGAVAHHNAEPRTHVMPDGTVMPAQQH